ncbi:MAG: PD-(D/E)XK nuclease family protein, partial [Myxococcales bacterium]|nr:PD-(D/E)XK nuclease family protein [Myxococcales bacterium]
LVHAVIADAEFDPHQDWLQALCRHHGRTLGASDAEITAAMRAAQDALGHPLLCRAKESQDRRFETPVSFERNGQIVEGVVDLAFRDGGQPPCWIVVDFKTDAQPDAHPQYMAQLSLYAEAIERATGMTTEAVLLAI